MSLTILFMPESAYGPTNNCIGIGDMLRSRGHRVVFAAEASWKGKLEALGFEEDLVDLAPPAEDGAGRRAVLEGLHPRDRAGVPQEHPGAAGDRHQADLGLAHRRRQVLRAPAQGDHRAGPAGRHRRGQRGHLPGAAHRRQEVRPDRLLQPAGGARRGHRAGLLRAARRRPRRVGRLPRRVRPHPPRDLERLQRLVRRAGHRAAARPGVHPRGRPEPLRLPGDPRLHRRPAARPTTGTASTPRSGRPTRTSSCPSSATRDRWSTSRSARSAPRTWS